MVWLLKSSMRNDGGLDKMVTLELEINGNFDNVFWR